MAVTPTATTALDKAGHAAAAEVYGFEREKVDLIKRTIAPDCSDAELQLFLYTAQRCGLDPLARQIYCIKRKGKATIQTSIDGYRLIADRTGDYAPGRAPTYEERDGFIVSATAYVLKWVRGTWHEIAATAYWDEYVQIYEGRPSQMWASKPRLMLGKCAESLALRRAFPAELSGIYTQDEMPEAEQVLPAPAEPLRLVANPPTHRVLTPDAAAAERKRLWLALDNVIREGKALGIMVGDAELMQAEGTAAAEDITAMGVALRYAIKVRQGESTEEEEDERGEFVPVVEGETWRHNE